MTGITAANKDCWTEFHATIWGAHTWPAGTVLGLNAQKGSADKDARGIWRPIGFFPIDDASAMWSRAEKEIVGGCNTYMNVAGQSASLVGAKGRGKAADVIALPAIVVDLDLRSGVHRAGDRNPTDDDAQRWMKQMPPATVTVHSGGGYHLWYALDELLYVNTAAGTELLARHKAAWIAVAAADTLNIDAGVLADVTRVLRLPGSHNFNNHNPVRIISADGPRYSIEALTALYPPAPTPATLRSIHRNRNHTAPPPQSPASPQSSASASMDGLDAPPVVRLGDVFARAWPVSRLALELFDAVIQRHTGLVFPDAARTYPGYDTARIYWANTDSPEKITIQSTTVQSVFGLTGSDHSWNSFDLLVHAITDPTVFAHTDDPRASTAYRDAARLVRQTEDHGTWAVEFIDALRNRIFPTIAEAFGISQTAAPNNTPTIPMRSPVPATPTRFTPGRAVLMPDAGARQRGEEQESADETLPNLRIASCRPNTPTPDTPTPDIYEEEGVVVVPVTVSEAIEAGISARFELDGGMTAVLYGTGGKHGFYQRVWTDSGGHRVEAEPRRLTTWVAFKSVEVAQMSVDRQGREIREGEPKVTVTIAAAPPVGAARGLVRSQDGFTVAQAHDPKYVLNALNVGVALPIGTSERNHVSNGLMTLGAGGTGTEKRSEFGTLGWMRDADTGKWVYLAPAASMTAEGPSHQWTVGAPPASDNGALGETQLAYGWPTLPEDPLALLEAAAAIPAFLAITPNNPAAFALLGTIFVSPLALPRRLTLFLAADPDSGKTLLVGAVQAFLTGLGGTAGFTGGDFAQPSAKGAPVAARWARHGCTIWDDYRLIDVDTDRVAITKAATTAITQAAYGGSSSGAKGTRGGGLARIVTADVTAIITGEGLPASTAVLSRVLAVQITRGDIKIFPHGTSPLDRFVTDHAAGAQQIYGAYIQWLTRKLDNAKTLETFRTENVRKRCEVTPTSGRSAELAGGLAVGWALFTEFAHDTGFAHLLPTMGDVHTKVSELAESTAVLVKDSNPAKLIINAARDALAAGAGHFDVHDNSTPPDIIARRLGWKWRPNPSNQMHGTGVWDISPRSLGTLSADFLWVVLKKQAVTDLQKTLGIVAPASQIDSAFAPLLAPGSKPGDQSPASLGLRRIRGYVLPAAMFDLGPHHDTPPDTPGKTLPGNKPSNG